MSWDDYYEEKLDLENFIGIIHSHRNLFESILKEAPKKILEIGAGSGATSIFLSYLLPNITVIDNNDRVLKIAEKNIKKFNGKINLKLADAFKLPFSNNSFDLVCHQGFFEHFNDNEIQRLLKEQLRVARKVVFSVPNNNYPVEKGYGDERFLSKKDWEEIFNKLNFKIEESENYCFWKSKIYLRAKQIMYLAKLS
jgi:ubiquinone/menaquinone biosynthesis C-methylase UbiE